MAEKKTRGEAQSSRQFRKFQEMEGWTKIWDPNKKDKNDKKVQESEQEQDDDRESDGHVQFKEKAHKSCCGGLPCKAMQRKTLDGFRKEMSAFSEADSDRRNHNRHLANKYKLPLSLVENLRDVFSKFDADNDGTVSGKEILDVFQTLGAIFTRQQCDDVIKSFLGGSISGEIDFEEMIKMFSHRKSNPKDYQQDLQLAFKMFDVDGDGYVCAEDLKHIMKSLGNDLSDEEIRTIYSHLDTDDNGLIDFAEFESILYPDAHQDPIVKKKHKKVDQPPKTPAFKSASQKKQPPKPGVVGLRTLTDPQLTGGSSGIYNAFYSSDPSDQQQRRSLGGRGSIGGRSGGGGGGGRGSIGGRGSETNFNESRARLQQLERNSRQQQQTTAVNKQQSRARVATTAVNKQQSRARVATTATGKQQSTTATGKQQSTTSTGKQQLTTARGRQQSPTARGQQSTVVRLSLLTDSIVDG